MVKLPLPSIRKVPYDVKKAIEEHKKSQPRSPCVDQTGEEIEQYYRTAPEGSPAAVRQTQGHVLIYTVSTIENRRTRVGRIDVPRFGDFYMKSGKNFTYPTGQTRLVVPTKEVIAWAEKHPRGETGYTIYR